MVTMDKILNRKSSDPNKSHPCIWDGLSKRVGGGPTIVVFNFLWMGISHTEPNQILPTSKPKHGFKKYKFYVNLELFKQTYVVTRH